METPTQTPSTWQRSITRRFIHWLFSWQTMRKVLFAFAVLVTLVAVAYNYETWRGKRTWEKYKREMEAKGERLDWQAFVPPALPDEKNFAATPFLKFFVENWANTNELVKRWAPDYGQAAQEVYQMRKKKAGVNSQERKPVDLEAWQAAFVKAKTGNGEPLPEVTTFEPAARAKAGTAVLEHLAVYQPVLEELHAASVRPGSRFSIRYDEENPLAILLPHLAEMKKICGVLQLHATANLALGRSDEAYRDVKLMLRMVDAIQNEPLLISSLVGIAMFRITTDVVWEGQSQWSEAQLQELQERLQQYNWVAVAESTLRSERAFCLKFMEYLRSRPNKAIEEAVSAGAQEVAPARRFFSLVPSGWLYLEQVNCARFFQENALGIGNTQDKRIDPAVCRAAEVRMEKAMRTPWQRFFEHSVLSGMLLPALIPAEKRCAEAQAVADEAALACALERYRRANNRFPDSLEALVPGYMKKLPHDVISGQPLLYHLGGNGQYTLYSVAWDGQDNGGLVSTVRSSGANNPPSDWVWRPGRGK